MKGNRQPLRKHTVSDAILKFCGTLTQSFALPDGVEVMNPFTDAISWSYTEIFYRKFYSDNYIRTSIVGINPGRFGGGVTGIPFTDPIRLEGECGIANDFKKLPELSSQFIYEVIKQYGGVEKFYRDFYFTAISPLGFTKNGLNLNYYDDRLLLKNAEGYIIDCFRKQLKTIPQNSTCVCLGEGKNYQYFSQLNQREKFYSSIIPLPHPRWVMQYKRKRMNEFVENYIETLELAKRTQRKS
jgi:hypothetical protein